MPQPDLYKLWYKIGALNIQHGFVDAAQITLIHIDQTLHLLGQYRLQVGVNFPDNVSVQLTLFVLYIPGIGKGVQAGRRGAAVNLAV